MKKIQGVLLIFVFFCTYASASSLDEAYKEMQAKKKEMISKSLHLSEEQSNVFWEIYAEYEAELESIHKEGFEIMQKYSDKYHNNTISVQDASNIMAGDFRAKAREIQLKEQYLHRYQEDMPAEVVLRFFQLETKIDMLLGADLANNLPVLEPDMDF